MDNKGKKTFALAAVIMLCAVAMVGVGYAAFDFASKTTSSKNPVSWGSVTVDDDGTVLNVNLLYGSSKLDGSTTYWLKDKNAELKSSAGATVTEKKITLVNRTSSDITISDSTTDLNKIITAKIGTLINSADAGKNAFPPSILNGMKFTFTATHGTGEGAETLTVTVTLGENGTVTEKTATGSITLKAKTNTTDQCDFKITMNTSGWAPVLTSNPENYGDSYFSLTFEFSTLKP